MNYQKFINKQKHFPHSYQSKKKFLKVMSKTKIVLCL